MGVRDVIHAGIRKTPRWVVYISVLLPFSRYSYHAAQGRLGADPVKVLEHGFGEIALQFLVAAMMITPLRELLSVNLIKFRRIIGQATFFYALMHLLVWVILDRQLDWSRILGDIIKRPYIILGFLAFVALIPLVLTSFDVAIRKIGALRWRRLHRLAYVAATLGAVHFVWLVKAWPPEPIVYLTIILLLLLYRRFRRQVRGFIAQG
jgi:sulfoxide reductase heme-binding subunit YedZ